MPRLAQTPSPVHTPGRPFTRRGLYTAADILRVESKWKQQWERQPDTYQADPSAGKKYILSMFPYPSGSLHMGHVRVYTISDVLSRYQRLRGAETLHPMGWDAFGLPAENAAIERAIPPATWTRMNIAQMRRQFDALSFNFDWASEVTTCREEYYRWTQWIFLRLFRRGLAYRQEGLVNWDPVDETVLADEQVDANGRSWRSGALVERRLLTQWYLKITEYQDRLLEGLKGLDWPQAVREMQTNWIIDKCEHQYEVRLRAADGNEKGDTLSVRVSKPEDWLYAESIVATNCEEGLRAVNPVTGRDLLVIQADKADKGERDGNTTGGAISSPMVKKGKQRAKSTGHPIAAGKRIVQGYRLRDWLISRQRYWGTPIPIVYCEGCGTVPIPEAELPLRLPEGVSFTGRGGSPLARQEDWVKTACPSCGGPARRETDTMDTFMDSSWYFLRYANPTSQDAIVDCKSVCKWLPVDAYVGGVEHAILHLLYARFINRVVMEELGIEGGEEPFAGLITQGLVEGITHKCPTSGRYLRPEEILTTADGRTTVKETGEATAQSWEKMSKSKYNGVDPIDLVQRYGADTLRICVAFKAPPEVPLQWNTRDIAGPQRWIVRLLNLAEQIASQDAEGGRADAAATERLSRALGQAVERMEFAYDTRNHRLNLAVAHLMKLTNDIESAAGMVDTSVTRQAMEALAVMLHPLAPHTSAELRTILQIDDRPLRWHFCDASRANAAGTVRSGDAVLDQQ